MIIVVGKWKQKLVRLAVLVLIVAMFAATIPRIAGIFYEKVPVFSGWMEDETPSGNPMSVEQTDSGSGSTQIVDQFVIKMQDFYLEDKE